MQNLAFDASGNMYVPEVDAHRVVVVGRDGVKIGEWEIHRDSGQAITNPGGMVADHNGVLYLPDFDAGVVLVFQIGPILAPPNVATPVN